jgi:hypothetical protein
MVCFSFLHYTSLCISCDKNLGEFLMLCFVLWALCCSFLSIKIYVCTWVDLLFVNNLDICSTSYGKKKDRESNSRPLKVGNWLDPSVCKWSAIHRWKALEESYNSSLDLIPIGGLSKELWSCKVLGVQIEIVSGLPLGSPGTKSHSDVGATERHKVYYMGEGCGFPQVRAVVNQVSPKLPVACPSTLDVN